MKAEFGKNMFGLILTLAMFAIVDRFGSNLKGPKRLLLVFILLIIGYGLFKYIFMKDKDV